MGSRTEDARPSVTLTQGTVVGTTLTDSLPRPVEAFKGIPYALPPTGDRRFRAPVKVEPSTKTIDASNWGPVAPGKQLFPGGPSFEYSEDCLTANVFRPPISTSQDEAKKPLLPVAVYIHGGAFNRGTAMMHNTASFLANSGQELVAVSFNYRIGALGFLPSTMSFEEGAVNLGLKDQLLLLEWVRDNISAFGGDPNNVTLFGISAGGHSIGHILLHDEGQYNPPLFHKVILESGAPTSRAVRPYSAPIHEAQFADFLAETGCPPGLSAAETFAHLRSAPSEVVQKAQITVFDKYNPSLRWAFQPVVDGDIIPRPPMESWRLNKWRKVPIMTGFNRNEGSIYISKKVSKSDEFTTFFADLLPLLSKEDVETIDRLYPDPLTVAGSPYKEQLDGTGAQYRRLEVAYGQYAYVAPVRQTADLASKSSPEPVYLYQWGLESSLLDRARHGENMYYETCEPAKTSISPAQKELCLTLNAYITSFILAGDPNAVRGESSPDRPTWEQYVATDPKALVFGEENKELVGGEPGVPARLHPDTWARKESEFWWSKVDLSQQ
ncbi:neuroligin-4,X-linked [Colletotrichum tofieldiae]|uniref:Carboxylic ester hydrolase n=1 Tax=Colletotrichum tofieldiae TaxID=708197 RepID=A0A166PC86_9PEZI|nr:neuroligin-4,X-linked (carboxylesterase) [Colletotrichum tofieldiae]GKT64240.1 neuroligin-4,X-linked [Colletotrichum tofieldiae]GKT74189.1 neuroligin-4,X-linked [Colletotrichum tofieldiae]